MKKDDIIKAALNEFSKSTYDNASVNNIIKESQTSKGTFYHHFKNKEELYLHLADMVLRDKIAFFKNAEQTKHTQNSNNIFDLFHLQVEKSIDFSLAHPEYIVFSIQTRNEPNKIIQKKIFEKMGFVSSDYYYSIIKENIDKSIIRDDLPIDFTVKIISYMFTNFLSFMETLNCKISIDNKDYIKEQYHYYISFIEKGLSAK